MTARFPIPSSQTEPKAEEQGGQGRGCVSGTFPLPLGPTSLGVRSQRRRQELCRLAQAHEAGAPRKSRPAAFRNEINRTLFWVAVTGLFREARRALGCMCLALGCVCLALGCVCSALGCVCSGIREGSRLRVPGNL